MADDKNDCRPASQDDASSPSHIHQVIDEAMTYLDPPPHESLTVDSVAHAYTILQQQAAASAASASAASPSHHGHCHPRLERMDSILCHEKDYDYSTAAAHKEWMLEQVDLYRALLLSSFLLLELLGSGSSDGESTKRLQSSVERCLLLLQILANDDDSLPTSRHALLQAVLEEPLIPLNKQERQYTYMLQRDKHDDGSDHCEGSIEEEHVMSTMDKRQLAREEQELVKLATRPIPNINAGVDQDAPPPDETPPPSIVQQGPLVWITTTTTNTTTTNNNNKTPCHVELHACGVLVVTFVGNQDRPCEHYYLTNRSTCEPRGDSSPSLLHNTGNNNMIVQTTVVSREMLQSTELSLLEFQADSLSLGYAWVHSIQRVIAKLKRGARLQNELRREWGEECYNDAVKKQVWGRPFKE